MQKYTIAAGLAVALLAVTAAPAGDIYKWVDEDGNVHFEDRPAGDDSERLDIQSRPTDPARVQAVRQASTEQRRQAEQAKAEAAADQPTAEEVQAEADERAKKCTDYRARLESYAYSRRMYRMTDDGEREYLDEDQMAAARELAAQRVADYCD